MGTVVASRQPTPGTNYWMPLPADNPQYSFSIMVEGTFEDNRDNTLEGGLLGGVDAGSIAKAIFDQIYPLPGKKDKDTAPTASTQTNAAAPIKPTLRSGGASNPLGIRVSSTVAAKTAVA